MGMQFDIADSVLLREPIDRARQEGYVAGECYGFAKGMATAIVTLLGLRFGPYEIPEGLVGHLTDLQPEGLDAMVRRIDAAASVEDILNSHMPTPTGSPGR